MENENLNPVEAEAVLTAEDMASFDELWNESDESDAATDTRETAEQETDAQQEPENAAPEAGSNEKTEETGSDSPEKKEEPEPEKQPEAENQRFMLKYNGQESEVDRDKVIELAQKGMDYDRIKEERDSFKADAPTLQRYKAQDEFLKELAENSGMDVEKLIESTKARMLMGKDSTLTEEAALKKVREEMAAKQPVEKKEEQKAAEPTPEERRQQMFARFLQAYPDVKAESIPKEVWEDAGRTFDLTGAYQRYENRQLRAEVETLRQNNKNKERSTGSRQSVGNATKDQAFDALWYDDD